MLCKYPMVVGRSAYGCGQCLPCRFNRRRVWTHRILLESLCHDHSAFVTLTYDDEHLPIDGALNVKEPQDWLKRFRKALEPRRIRYYLVGEYGDVNFRPHYHAIIFGYPRCSYGYSRYSRSIVDCCAVCDLVRDTWARGFVSVGELTAHSAQYVCGYVTKKMTSKDDFRLDGRHPEFARMSLRPGLGANAMHDIASALMQFNLESSEIDVPSHLRHGSRNLPLGRYLRRRLRLLTGRDEGAPQEVLDAIRSELSLVFEAASSIKGDRRLVVSHLLSDLEEGRIRQIENKVVRSRNL